MFRVEVSMRDVPRGSKVVHCGYLDERLATEEDAAEAIKAAISGHNQHGHNEDKICWWCRNAGERKNMLFMIKPIDVSST